MPYNYIPAISPLIPIAFFITVFFIMYGDLFISDTTSETTSDTTPNTAKTWVIYVIGILMVLITLALAVQQLMHQKL
jgi:hypothetical protein